VFKVYQDAGKSAVEVERGDKDVWVSLENILVK